MKLILLVLSLFIFSSHADKSIADEKTDESRYQVVTRNLKTTQGDDYMTYDDENRSPVTQEYKTIYDLDGFLNPGYNRQLSQYGENIPAYNRQLSQYQVNNDNPAYNRQLSRYGENINVPVYNRQLSQYYENNGNPANNRQQPRYEENVNLAYNRQLPRYGENVNLAYNRQQPPYGENVNLAYNRPLQSGYEENVNLLHKQPEYNENSYRYNNRYRLEGREGLGFDKRTAFALGLRYPLTLQLLYTIRRYPNEKPELQQRYQY